MESTLTRTQRELEQQIQKGLYSHQLPAIRNLARSFGVSVGTMSKVLHALAAKGTLTLRQGRPARLTGSSCESASPAAERLARALTEQIGRGRFKAGEALPKIRFFVVEHRVSNHTVREALKLLEKREVLYRRGRHYVVGKKRRHQVTSNYHLKPVVVVIAPHFNRWLWAAGAFMPGTLFYTAFMQELERNRIRVDVTFLEKRGDQSDTVCGIRAIQAHIKALKKRYLGCLFFANSRSALIEHARPLAALGRVVWHNIFQTPLPFGRRHAAPRSFFWSRHDEKGGIDLCLRHLYQRGHRRIAVSYRFSGQPRYEERWIHERAAGIAEHGRREFPGVEIVIIPVIKCGKNDAVPPCQPRRVSKEADPEPIDTSPTHAGALGETLCHSGITALVALNDDFAADCIRSLSSAGVSVPRDISVISFDNSLLCPLLRLTSIDFNAHHHGYLLSHLFLRDVPIDALPNGRIPVEPFISERNSVRSIDASLA